MREHSSQVREPGPQSSIEASGAPAVKAAQQANSSAESTRASDARRARLDLELPNRLEIVCAVLVSILFVIEKVRVVRRIGMDYTTEDQTIFWWVTQDYTRLRFHEPLFYGSPYSSHLESVLAAPLVLLGARFNFAIPFVTALLTAAPFALLAVIAWRRGLY